MQIQKPIVPQPKLRREYPIETVLQSEYAIVYDVQADEVLLFEFIQDICSPDSNTAFSLGFAAEAAISVRSRGEV